MVYRKKKGFVRVAEAWYHENEDAIRGIDVLRYKYVPQVPDKSQSVERLHTIIFDLSRSDDELWDDISKTTKYQIKRAKERDPVSIATLIAAGQRSENALSEYIDFFNEFAGTKKRNGIRYTDLAQFYEAGTLVVRSATDTEKNGSISMHAYVVSDNRARLHQSSSLYRLNDDAEYRSMTGRANRLLHWDDMLYFKNAGIAWYDFGGWYGGNDDKEKLAINSFKESFGGVKLDEVSCVVPVSFRGKTATFARKLLRGK